MSNYEVSDEEVKKAQIRMGNIMEQAINPMPKSIATAVNEIMLKLQKPLEHDAENKFQKYKYTSIDGFLKQVHPVCADAGLIIVPH